MFHDRQIPNFSRSFTLFPKQFKDFSRLALNSRLAGAGTPETERMSVRRSGIGMTSVGQVRNVSMQLSNT